MNDHDFKVVCEIVKKQVELNNELYRIVRTLRAVIEQKDPSFRDAYNLKFPESSKTLVPVQATPAELKKLNQVLEKLSD